MNLSWGSRFSNSFLIHTAFLKKKFGKKNKNNVYANTLQ